MTSFPRRPAGARALAVLTVAALLAPLPLAAGGSGSGGRGWLGPSASPPPRAAETPAPASKPAPETASPAAALAAIEAAEDALSDLWARGPYMARRAGLVSRKAAIYGDDEPRATNAYAPGEPILLYVEPVGYDWKRQGERYTVGVTIDVELRTKDGKIVGGQKGFQTAELSTRRRVREFFLNLTLTLDGVEPGAYVAAFTLNDHASGRSVSTEHVIVIKA